VRAPLFGAYALPLVCAGDSSPRIVAQADAAPAPVPAGVPRDIQFLPAVVDHVMTLADDATPTAVKAAATGRAVPQGKDALFLNELRKMLDSNPLLNGAQKERLENKIELALSGHVPLLEIVRELGQYLEADFVRRLRQEGFVVEEVKRGGHVYLKITGRDNRKLNGTFHPLLELLSTVGDSQPGAKWIELRQESLTRHTTLTIPNWETWLSLMSPHLDKVVWMVREATPHEINQLHAEGKAPVTLMPEGAIHFPGQQTYLHGLSYAIHDLLHVLIVQHLSPEVLTLVTALHDLIERAAQEEAAEWAFREVLKQLADANYCNMSVFLILQFLNITIQVAGGDIVGVSADVARQIGATLGRVRSALEAHPIPGVSAETHRELLNVLR
jgi:hypothetical protein